MLGIYLLLAGLTFVTYKQVLHHQFIDFDDNVYVAENPHIQKGLTFENIRSAFTTGRASNWHPITWLSHIADYEMFGLNPWGHHLVNVLLHTANTLLLFGVLNVMTGSTSSLQAGSVWQSAFVAVLFALHPLHIESVAWVAERKDVLSGLFFMLTVAAYLRYVRQTGTKWYLLTILLFALGLMTKPMLVTLPFVLLLLDWWPLKRLQNKKDIYLLVIEKVPFFVLSAVSSVVTFLVQQSTGAVSTMEKFPPATRIANAMVSYMVYLEKMVWPSRLAVLYPYPVGGLPVQQVIKAVLLLTGISYLVIRLARNHKYLLVGWLWYAGTLVPVIGLVQVGSQAMADRYTYLPSIGIFIMVAWGFDELLTGRRWRETALGVSAVAVLLVLSTCTGAQLRYWQNSVTLFEQALKVTSNNHTAYNNLGVAYIKLGRYKEAAENCKEAIKIRPNYARAYDNLGVAYFMLNRYNEAIENCERAIKIRPNYAEAYNDAATVYGRLGRYNDAIERYKQAVRIKPDYAEAQYNLGTTYGSLGRYNEAIEAYREAIKIRPNYAEAYNNLGTAYDQLGRHNEALEAYKQAVKIKPDLVEAHYNLGMAYLVSDDRGSALEEYKILKSLNEGMANKLFSLIYK